MVRRALLALIVVVAAACGGGAQGFVIDQVTISPDSVPIGSTSTEKLKIGAQVADDIHQVLSVWATSDGNAIWIDLKQSKVTDGSWSGSIPVYSLAGIPVGDYWFDLHATDDGGRQVDLTHAVKLHISG